MPRGLVTRLLIVMLGGLAYMLSKTEVSLPLRISIGFFLVEVFVSCFFCHSEAVALRPQRASESTLFYLLFAAGGALGSFLIGIASPMLFRFNYDLAITFLVTALLAFAGDMERRLEPADAVGCRQHHDGRARLLAHIAYQRETIAAVRNFYGTLRVRQNHGYPGSVMRTLTQRNHPARHAILWHRDSYATRQPATMPRIPVWVSRIRFCCEGGRATSASSVWEPERSPRMAAPATTSGSTRSIRGCRPSRENVFTYIRDSGAQVADRRRRRPAVASRMKTPQRFDVLVVDAFSGDAIPLHLLTTQAVALYRRHLAPGRNPGLPHLQPACRSGAAHRPAGQKRLG